ncbi:hypothetical protein RHSIM_Rhsim13G0183000 [Rhododendron simsii]|uniref:GDSL esterase/lipase n=1 Tax=Rhododendron simsii TaxID=118357 RepID=A0A834L6Y8_RHOSS|nr:hypothetical protein RHSIM_Rhsim13G0183000 [Rhododendron simsii]
MSTQLEYFKEYKAKLASTIGQEEADNQTTSAVFIVNCAVNDFAINYYGLGNVVGHPDGTTIEQYEEFVLQRLREFIQGLVELGARRIAVSGVPLFGCCLNVITLYSSDPANALVTRTCNETLNSVGSDYNAKVQEALNTMQSSLANQGLKLAYFDTYTPMLNILQNPANYGKLQNPGTQVLTTSISYFLFVCLFVGFDVINKGCCGTGLLEQAVLCNPLSAICSDRSKYEFFDSVHLTEAASSVIAGANIAAINSITN